MTIKEHEQYNAPRCKEYILAVHRRILSGSPIINENPEAEGEDFDHKTF